MLIFCDSALKSNKSGDFMDDRELSAKELHEQHLGRKEEKEHNMDLLDDILSESFRVDDSVAIKSNASRLAGLLEAVQEEKDAAQQQKATATERSTMSASEWEKVKNKYITTPATELERLREKFIGEQTKITPDDSTSESDLAFLKSSRSGFILYCFPFIIFIFIAE
jgi:hypothetical protein